MFYERLFQVKTRILEVEISYSFNSAIEFDCSYLLRKITDHFKCG